MSKLLFSTETLFTNKSIELLTEENDRNKKVIYELKSENTKLTKRIKELEEKIITLRCIGKKYKNKLVEINDLLLDPDLF